MYSIIRQLKLMQERLAHMEAQIQSPGRVANYAN